MTVFFVWYRRMLQWGESEDAVKLKPPNEDAKDFKADDEAHVPYYDFVNFCGGFKYLMQMMLKSFSIDTVRRC